MARNLEVAKLLYRLELEAKGFESEVGKVEKRLGSLADFIKKNPVAALGALGAAAVGVGIAATDMAADVDTALRRVANAAGLPVSALKDLGAAARDLSIEFGTSQTEIARVMELVARTGIESSEDLIAASRAAVRAQRATGEEFESIIGLIDSAMDNFGVTAGELDKQLAKVVATTKGKLNLAELEEVLKAIGPTAKAAGVNFTTMVEAVVAIRPTAKNAKDAISELNNAIAQPGGLEKYAANARVATDGIAEFEEQIALANDTVKVQSDILKERFNAVLIDLGVKILPLVIAGLRSVADLIDIITGAPGQIEHGAAFATVNSLAGVINKLDPPRRAEELKRLTAAMRELTDAPAGALRNPFQAIEAGLANVGKLSREELGALKRGLEAAAASGELNKTSLDAVARSLVKVNEAIDKKKPIIKPEETAGLDHTVTRLEQINKLAASGAGLDEITKALGVLSKAETDAANKAIANNKKAEAAAKARAKAEESTAKIILAAVGQIGAKMSETSAGLGKLGDQIRDNYETAKKAQDKVKDGSDEIARLQAKVNQLLAKYKDDQEKIAQKESERVASAQRLASQLGGVAQGLLGAAQAAGILDDHMAATLGHVINVAEQIADIKFSDKDLFDPANLTSLVGILGSVAGILHSLFSGESAESKAHKALIKANNEVLAELVEVNGDLLRINQPGAKLTGVQAAVTAALSKPAGAGFNLGTELAKVGLTIKDLDEVAKDLGISIRNSGGGIDVAGLRQLLTALQSIDVGFADDFEGEMDKIRAFIKAGLIEPSQEFAAKLDVATKKSPAIAAALEGVNPFTEEGRAAAKAAFQQLILDFTSGKLDKAQLGDLTGSQFIDIITGFIESLSGTDELKPLSGTGLPGGTGDQGPLEFTPDAETSDYYSGSLEAAGAQTDLLTQGVSFEERQADTLDEILATLRAGQDSPFTQAIETLLGSLNSGSPVAPPRLPDSVLQPFGQQGNGPVSVLLHFGDISVPVTAPPGTDGAAQGQAAAVGFTEHLNRTLGDDFNLQRLLAGQLGGGIIRR